MFRNKAIFYGEWLLVPLATPKWRTIYCRLSAVAYSMYFQLLSIVGDRPSICNPRTSHAVVTRDSPNTGTPSLPFENRVAPSCLESTASGVSPSRLGMGSSSHMSLYSRIITLISSRERRTKYFFTMHKVCNLVLVLWTVTGDSIPRKYTASLSQIYENKTKPTNKLGGRIQSKVFWQWYITL
jgi:hypothetical protein